MLRSVQGASTDEHGCLHVTGLEPREDYVICVDAPPGPAGRMPSRQAIVDWIEGAILGDLRTLIIGIQEREKLVQGTSLVRLLGGCNFLLASGCCMALEYLSQVYGKGTNATAATHKYVEDFLAPIEPRYLQIFGVLWSSFRNGLIHGSWPQVVGAAGDGGRRIAVGANNSLSGEHLQPTEQHQGDNFVISSHRFFNDIETSFDQRFRDWILSDADDGVLERAAPRLLAINPGDMPRQAEFAVIVQWNSQRPWPTA